ncbi:ISAs1 family transposase, partial [Escherichia coli]|uniref:ISAs1 family transposase n=1 Tax=Escherichia coli TaxID=562 RepID=UPI00201B14CC
IIAEQKKEPEMTVRYYISSADLTAEKFATAIRNHWHVENKLHRRLDVVMNEGDYKIRRGNAAELFSGIRHIAINILTNEKVFKAGLRRKMRKAAMESLYIDLCNCLILICSIQHQMKVNLWTKNSYRLWLTNWPKTS